jgi:3-hydroxybutyryl-CoA dehydrogenase
MQGKDRAQTEPAKECQHKKGQHKEQMREHNKDDSTPPINRVAIVGAGYMGRQISLQCAVHSIPAALVDPADQALEQARLFHADQLQERCQAAALNEKQANATQTALSYHSSLETGLEAADLVIEAIPEKLELKEALFTRLDALCPPPVLLATNSSSLRIDQLEHTVSQPQRLLNLHFFAVIWERPMIELMRGNHTTDACIERAADFARRIAMVPLRVRGQSTGFLFNRVWRAIKKETLHLVDQGVADFEDVDRAWIVMFGTDKGPFGMMDDIGLDVVRDIETVYWHQSGRDDDAPPPLLTDKVNNGDLGVKSGRGFYTYPDPAFEKPGWLEAGKP